MSRQTQDQKFQEPIFGLVRGERGYCLFLGEEPPKETYTSNHATSAVPLWDIPEGTDIILEFCSRKFEKFFPELKMTMGGQPKKIRISAEEV